MELQADRMTIVFAHLLAAYAALVAPLLSYRKVRQLRRAETTPDKTRLYRHGRSRPDVVSMNRPCFTPFVAISALAKSCTRADLPRTRITSMQLS